MRSKRNAQCRIKTGAKADDSPEPKKFADRISFDHAIINGDENDDVPVGEKARVSLIIQDAFTKWL